MADKKISALTAATTPLVGTEVLPIVQSGTTVKVSVANLTVDRPTSAASYAVTGGTPPANGVYLPAANAVGIAASGAEQVRVTSGALQMRNGTALYVYNATNDGLGLWYNPGGAGVNQLTARVNGADRETINGATGDITNHTGNFVIGTAGRGIDFSANANAPGMTSELLNWYEEGTWTPTLQGGSTAGSYTVATTTAQYTRVGRMVTVTAGMAITVNSAGTGVARFGGLPFTKGANQFLNGSVSTSAVSYGANVISVNVQAWTSGASTDFALLGVRSGTAPYDVAITDFVTGSVVYVTFTYFV